MAKFASSFPIKKEIGFKRDYSVYKLSVVVPSFEDGNSLVDCLNDIVVNSVFSSEIIVLVDGGSREHASFVEKISLSGEDRKKGFDLIKVFNPSQMWVNYNWNTGADMARGKYVAFLNSDIRLPFGWDYKLVSKFDDDRVWISCPYEKRGKVSFKLPAFMSKRVPHMIKGACFVIRKDVLNKIFPIPDDIVHWFGDNWIADRVQDEGGGVAWSRSVIITHQVEVASRKVDRKVYLNRILEDCLAYQKHNQNNLQRLEYAKEVEKWIRKQISSL